MIFINEITASPIIAFSLPCNSFKRLLKYYGLVMRWTHLDLNSLESSSIALRILLRAASLMTNGDGDHTGCALFTTDCVYHLSCSLFCHQEKYCPHHCFAIVRKKTEWRQSKMSQRQQNKWTCLPRTLGYVLWKEQPAKEAQDLFYHQKSCQPFKKEHLWANMVNLPALPVTWM